MQRSRNNQISIRLSDSEYTLLKNKIEASGLSQRQYLLSLVTETNTTSSIDLRLLKNINCTLSDLTSELRHLSQKVDRLQFPDDVCNEELLFLLQEITTNLKNLRSQGDTIWQLIRLSIKNV